ncbi:SOS response-associated peptidase [Aquimarina muelleri]|uniref:Abasic site processing protein n=1 Tax=Aquimarina muelleri TaxID=279356 RepID=A0A918JSX2_9FLAO|nr:SOS response-associated peptidase family protein [Aquimarina muelleri]MCX2764366.1 SOS response-associated peptidase [Aquimarina muelleri]GGX04865.1 DUF159 family protein [Aquimarina muelleri]
MDMYNKVSNTAERKMIENEFGVTFKFPKLYKPSPVINGAEEATLSIITMENPDIISYGIWGILPNDYKDEWMDFQNVLSTLSVNKKNLNRDFLFKKPFRYRRCLIIVTGFFINHLHNGHLYPYYVYLNTKKPFCLAGVYNTLDDGFLTCSIVVTNTFGVINKIQNINSKMPVVVPKDLYKLWLNQDSTSEQLNDLIVPSSLKFQAHPIAKEFFKNGISYESMLEPVYYKDIPNRL